MTLCETAATMAQAVGFVDVIEYAAFAVATCGTLAGAAALPWAAKRGFTDIASSAGFRYLACGILGALGIGATTAIIRVAFGQVL